MGLPLTTARWKRCVPRGDLVKPKRNEDKTPQPPGDTKRERRECRVGSGEGKTGRQGEGETRRKYSLSPCPLVALSPRLCSPPVSSSHTLRPTHSLTLCLRAAAA